MEQILALHKAINDLHVRIMHGQQTVSARELCEMLSTIYSAIVEAYNHKEKTDDQ